MSNAFENILASAKKQTEKSISISKSGDLEIIEDGLEWIEVPGGKEKKKGKRVPFYRKDILEWNTLDFFNFYLCTFKKVTGGDFMLGFVPGQQNILKVQDAIAEIKGSRPTKIETRDYIEWFVSNKSLHLINRYSCFKMKFMCSPYDIESYLSLGKESKQSSSVNEQHLQFSMPVMNEQYSAGEENFIIQYGLIISVIWLMRIKKLNESDAVNLVKSSVVKMNNAEKYLKIISATEGHNPYPILCKFDGLRKMLADLTVETGEFFDILDIRFSPLLNGFSFLDNKEM